MTFPTSSVRTVTVVLVTMLAVGYGLYTWRTGAIASPDTSTYSRRADLLIAVRFDYASYLRQLDSLVHPGFTVAWITVVALFKCTFGTAWKEALVALNWVMSVVINSLILVVVQRSTKSAAAVVFVAIWLALAYELFSWIPYVLSDVSFVALMLTLLVVTINLRRLAGVALLSSYLTCATLALTLLLYRPTAMPAVLTVCVALAFGRVSRAEDPAARGVFARRFAAGAATLLIVCVVAHAAVVQNPTRWPIDAFRLWITHQLSVEARLGWVIHDRPETYRAAPVSRSDYLLLTASRGGHFMMVAAQQFSTAHKLLNSIFFLPLYVFALVAVAQVLGRHSRLRSEAWWTAWVFSVLVMSLLTFHSLQKIDFDWRYRVPVLPPLCILAGIGFAECWRRVTSVCPFQRPGIAAPEPAAQNPQPSAPTTGSHTATASPPTSLLGEDGRVKVLDFGLASVGDSGPAGAPDGQAATQQVSQVGQVLGTVHYMSPEPPYGTSSSAGSLLSTSIVMSSNWGAWPTNASMFSKTRSMTMSADSLADRRRRSFSRSSPNSSSAHFAVAAGAAVREEPNLDFALAAVARVLRLPPGSPLTLFAIGRTIGWIGHAIEQYATGQLIRPRAKYVGVVPAAPPAIRGHRANSP